ncbi:MAG: hypothetical protein EOM91_10165 [Sphingobacteriia bacterium]|nr:hypothetical protein [Sphingobacteriia bacterium]
MRTAATHVAATLLVAASMAGAQDRPTEDPQPRVQAQAYGLSKPDGGQDARPVDHVYSSVQVDHPVITGIASALTLGAYPERYGDDVQQREWTPTMNAGYGRDAYEYIRSASLGIFEVARAMTLLAMAALVIVWLCLERDRLGAAARRFTTRVVNR